MRTILAPLAILTIVACSIAVAVAGEPVIHLHVYKDGVVVAVNYVSKRYCTPGSMTAELQVGDKEFQLNTWFSVEQGPPPYRFKAYFSVNGRGYNALATGRLSIWDNTGRLNCSIPAIKITAVDPEKGVIEIIGTAHLLASGRARKLLLSLPSRIESVREKLEKKEWVKVKKLDAKVSEDGSTATIDVDVVVDTMKVAGRGEAPRIAMRYADLFSAPYRAYLSIVFGKTASMRMKVWVGADINELIDFLSFYASLKKLGEKPASMSLPLAPLGKWVGVARALSRLRILPSRAHLSISCDGGELVVRLVSPKMIARTGNITDTVRLVREVYRALRGVVHGLPEEGRVTVAFSKEAGVEITRAGKPVATVPLKDLSTVVAVVKKPTTPTKPAPTKTPKTTTKQKTPPKHTTTVSPVKTATVTAQPQGVGVPLLLLVAGCLAVVATVGGVIVYKRRS